MSHQCTGKKLWYVCSVGPFQGCCSVDPCAAGVCPDDDDKTTAMSTSTYTMVQTVTPTKSKSSTLSTAGTTMTTTSRSETTGTTTSPARTSSTSTETSTANNVGANAAKSGETPIGAIVGGVIGAIVFLILLAIALFFAYRRGKKGLAMFDTDNNSDPTTTEQVIHAPAKQEKTEAGSLLTPTDYSTSGTTPISPTSTAAELDSFHLHPPSPYTSFVPPNASALELGDTGVHRPRVELASQPTRELINVPHHQRQSAVWLEQSDSGCAELAAQPCRELINVPPHQRQQSPILSSPILSSPSPSPSQVQTDSNRANSPPVITADGIVLSANFDTSAPDTPSNRGTNSSHAMSFMDFGSARRSMLSAHRPEWENKSEEGRPNTPEGEKSSSASK